MKSRLCVLLLALLLVSLPSFAQSSSEDVFFCQSETAGFADLMLQASNLLKSSTIRPQIVLNYFLDGLTRIYSGCVGRGVKSDLYDPIEGSAAILWEDKYLLEALTTGAISIAFTPIGDGNCLPFELHLAQIEGQQRNWDIFNVPDDCMYSVFVTAQASKWEVYFHRLALYPASIE